MGRKSRKLFQKAGYIIGIDEAGRGALAGPVAAGVVILRKDFRYHFGSLKLDDSKKLSPEKRELWYDYLKSMSKNNPSVLSFAVSFVSPIVVDRINISRAADLAAETAFLKVLKINKRAKPSNAVIYLDAGLNLNQKIIKKFRVKQFPRADGKINAVKMASIMAKVERDRKMEKFDEKFFRYGFLKHKGYGTRYHLKAISKYGFCKIHRVTFLGK